MSLWDIGLPIIGGAIAAAVAYWLDIQKFRRTHEYEFEEMELLKRRDALRQFLGVPINRIGIASAKAARIDRTKPDAMEEIEKVIDPALHDSAVEIRPLFRDNKPVWEALTSLANLTRGSIGAYSSGESPVLLHEAYQGNEEVLTKELERLDSALSELWHSKGRFWRFWHRE